VYLCRTGRNLPYQNLMANPQPGNDWEDLPDDAVKLVAYNTSKYNDSATAKYVMTFVFLFLIQQTH
jgi:hypothetical protein